MHQCTFLAVLAVWIMAQWTTTLVPPNKTFIKIHSPLRINPKHHSDFSDLSSDTDLLAHESNFERHNEKEMFKIYMYKC